MTPDEIHGHLQRRHGDSILEYQSEVLDPCIRVAPDHAFEVLATLRTDSALAFDSLMCLSGVDYSDRLEVVYHLHSMQHLHTFTVKVSLDRDNPRVKSVESLWRTADWHEREAFDMFGIVFTEHPDLRRILCPEDWEGYPLRKDYQVQEYYQGIYVPYPGVPPASEDSGATKPAVE